MRPTGSTLVVVGLLLFHSAVPPAWAAGPESAQVLLPRHEPLSEFLEHRSPAELGKRGGRPLFSRSHRPSPELVREVIDRGAALGYEFTPEQVLAASMYFREGDSPEDMAKITAYVLPAIVTYLAWQVGSAVVTQGAAHLAYSLSNGQIGEPWSSKEVLKDIGWGMLTGGIMWGGRAGWLFFKAARGTPNALRFTEAARQTAGDAFRITPFKAQVQGLQALLGDNWTGSRTSSSAGRIDPGQMHGPSTYSCGDYMQWAQETAGPAVYDLYSEEWADLDVLAASVPPEGDPVLPLGMTVSDGSACRPLVPNSGNVQITYAFAPGVTGTHQVSLGVFNQGMERILSTRTYSIQSTGLHLPIEETFSVPAQNLLNLNAGSDPEFYFFLRFSQGSFLGDDYGPTGQGYFLYVDGAQNLPPMAAVSAGASGRSVRFHGSYYDADGNGAANLTLQIDGPRGRQNHDLRPYLEAGDPRTELDFSRTLLLDNGVHTYRLLVSDGVHTRTVGDFPLRVSETAPRVTISLARSTASVGETVGGTVTVTDAAGPVPAAEVGLATDGRGPFRDGAGQKVRKVTTNAAGSAAFTYEVVVSGQHTLMAMEPTYELAWVNLNVPGNPSDWTMDWTWHLVSSSDTEAAYDAEVLVRYQGTLLDPGDYVYFSANHGTWQKERDQVGASGVAFNSFSLTKAEADSGSEVITLELPRYGVELQYVTDLPVGAPSAFDPVRTTALAGDGSSDESYSVAFSRDGRYAARTRDRFLDIYRRSDLALLRTVHLDFDDLTGLAFSPDGNHLAAGDQSGGVWKVEVATGAATRKSLTNSRADIVNLHWYAPDRIAACSEGGSSTFPYDPGVFLLDANLNLVRSKISLPGMVSPEDIPRVACSAASGLCAAVGGSGDQRFFVFTTGGSVVYQEAHPDLNPIGALAFNAAGDRLLVGGDSNAGLPYVRLLAVSSSGATTLSPPLTTNQHVYAARFFTLPQGERLAIAGNARLEVFESFSGAAPARSTAGLGPTFSESYYLDFLDGPRQLAAIDRQQQAFYNFSGDDYGPAISLSAPEPLPYEQTAVSIPGRASDPSGVAVAELRTAGGGWQPLTLGADGSFTVSLAGLTVGDTLVEVGATDVYGNRTQAGVTVTRRDDTTAPVVSLTRVTPGAGVPGTVFVITSQVSDADAGVGTVTAVVRDPAGGVAATLPMSPTGGGGYAASFSSTGATGGFHNVDIQAADASSHANTQTVAGAAGFSVVVSTPVDFYTVPPCRLLDTRSTAALRSQVTVYFDVAGACGIPASARAVSMNVTVVASTGNGHLTLWPADLARPVASTINYATGKTRANNAILALATDGGGDLGAQAVVAGGGTVHLIVDVSGYFQ